MYTAGEHSDAMSGLPSRGIHVFWASKVDELLESGIMPKNSYNILQKLAKNQEQRDIIPTAVQLHNRKRFIFQRKYVIDTTNDLRNFLRPHKVLLPVMPYCFSDGYVSPHRSTLTTWIQKRSRNSLHHECSCWRDSICRRIMEQCSMAGYSLARVKS